jgi:hypothetical protein
LIHQYLPVHARSFDKYKDSTLLSGKDTINVLVDIVALNLYIQV